MKHGRSRWVYWIFQKILTLGVYVFFKRIVVSGRQNVPKTGPLILSSNHPNMALDPVLVGLTCGRNDNHFWAKSTLFSGVTGAIARSLGAIPVKRKQDFGEGTRVDNQNLFESSLEVLDDGESMCIFPEGVSYTDTKLQPIKPGTIRLALEFLKATKGKESVPIVPCGINYARKDKFRSQVLVHYGKPLMLPKEIVNSNGEIAEGYDEKELVQEYTDLLAKRMANATINAPDFETMQLFSTTRRLYTNGRELSLEQWLMLSKRITKLYEKYHQVPEVVELIESIRQYQNSLDSLQLRDVYFSCGISLGRITWFLLTRMLTLLAVFPFAVLGTILHFPIYAVPKLLSESLVKDIETKSTVKIGVTLFLTWPITYTVTWALIWYLFGFKWLLASLFLLPLIGLANIWSLEQGVLMGRSLVQLLRILGLLGLGLKATLLRIQEQRTALVKRLQELAPKYYKKDKYIFPDDPAPMGLVQRKTTSLPTADPTDLFL